MKPKKIEYAIKSYFYFNKQERKGIITLLIILFSVILLPKVYSSFYTPPEFNFQVTELPEIPADSFEFASPANHKVEGAFFNPNTARDEQLRSLGFTPKNIETLHHYKSSGGFFKKPEDLTKLFGIRKTLLKKLIPLVMISDSFPKNGKDTTHKTINTKFPIDLNSADSASIVSLYKIGPALTHRIIEYRVKLGGFLNLNQLIEVWGFDEDLLYDLQDKITVNARLVKRFDLNTVTAEDLKTHPYFKFKLSNAIINYRTQHGQYQSLDELRKIVLVNDSIYNRITKYLILQ